MDRLPVRGMRPGRPVRAFGVCASVLAVSGALMLSGCDSQQPPPVIHARVARAADALVRFTSCGDALRNLRAAASRAVGPTGFALDYGGVRGVARYTRA